MYIYVNNNVWSERFLMNIDSSYVEIYTIYSSDDNILYTYFSRLIFETIPNVRKIR